MAAAKLDRSRPYAEVWGAKPDGPKHRYEQDHKLFDAQGNEIVEKRAPASKPKSKPADPGKASGDVMPEDKPVEEVKMADLRARYAEVTGGGKIKAGINKEDAQRMIKEALPAVDDDAA